MDHTHWNDWYSSWGWGWIVWFGFIFLMFSSIGNWGYSYRVHRKYYGQSRKQAADILNERYVGGELTREQYLLLKSDISNVK